eukprot:CAMPEP_0178425094 /NCGR_PEP_ID=MMETSP0689_2-20121128/28546_1 /TAXON_ID=160604 /ORGANISM="Amphidinium massartii, Strain CS-259" /LENGTH=245 /DNA_ID=CAMNT_0020046747 /DNA_START=73 /DNA_END=810 /DNA_ORIENTATION=+
MIRPKEPLPCQGSSTKADDPPQNDHPLDHGVPETVIQVQLEKIVGCPLGFTFKEIGTDIVITSIGRGSALEEWNRNHAATGPTGAAEQVLVGDVIISINGVHGCFWHVAQEAWRPGKVVIEVRRASLQQGGPAAPGVPAEEDQCRVRRRGSRVYLADCGPTALAPFRGPVDHFKHVCASDTLDATECAVCLEDFLPTDIVVQMPCNHVFHPYCAAQWLARGSQQCPLCRASWQQEEDGPCCTYHL